MPPSSGAKQTNILGTAATRTRNTVAREYRFNFQSNLFHFQSDLFRFQSNLFHFQSNLFHFHSNLFNFHQTSAAGFAVITGN